MNIYITRHGKTIWNQEGRFQGRKNSDLTKDGIRDAYSLQVHIQDLNIDKIYSSPIKRAKQTTELIFSNRKEIPILYDDRIQEMGFGDWEGKLISEIIEEDTLMYHNLWNHPLQFSGCPNGEDYQQVEKRVYAFLHQMIAENNKHSIFIVTHGMIYVTLMAYFKRLQIKDYPLINKKVVRGCSLTTIKYSNGNFIIEKEGDESFLVKDQMTKYQ